VIVVDDLHIEASQTFRARDAFRQLTDTLIREGDLVGVVSTRPSAIALSVSADHTRPASAAERITGDGFGPDALIRNFPPDPNGSRELSAPAGNSGRTSTGSRPAGSVRCRRSGRRIQRSATTAPDSGTGCQHGGGLA